MCYRNRYTGKAHKLYSYDQDITCKERRPHPPSEYSTGILRTHPFISPEWATAEWEVFLEDLYAIYQQLKYQKKWSLFKEFWISLIAD